MIKEHRMKQRNIGIDILKSWMAFEVVLCHFGVGISNPLYTYFFSHFQGLAVPLFMLSSFYLSGKLFFDEEYFSNKFLFKRVWRIYYPVLSWAIVYLLFYVVLHLGGIAQIKDGNVSQYMGAFLWQITTGHSLNSPMWFNIVLFYLTFLYYFMKFFFGVAFFDYLIVLSAFCAYVVQVLGLYNCFSLLGYELSYPLGRFIEMVPYASIGLLIYRSILKPNRLIYLLILLSTMILLKLMFMDNNTHYYGYGGLVRLLEAVVLFFLFIKIKIKNKSKVLERIIVFISKYSMGVYCIHILVGKLLGFLGVSYYLSGWWNSIVIYFVSLFSAYLISRIPIKPLKLMVE